MGINEIAIGPDLDNLDASRKADREKLARAFIGIAQRHGAQVERREEQRSPGYCGAGIFFLRFTLNGVGGNVTINNIHGGDFALIHWHNDYANGHRKNAQFAWGFPGAAGVPHHKATSHPRSWLDLANALDRGLSMAASGEAFRSVSQA